MPPEVPDELLTELDADVATARGSLTKVDARKRGRQKTRASIRAAGIFVALLAVAGIVATLHSIADSDAKAPAGDTPFAYGAAPNATDEAHARDSPTQAAIAANMPSHRNRSSCPECGVVESIRQIERSGAAGATGAGNAKVDRGNPAGESAGVVVTNATMEPGYEIRVRFRDGSSSLFTQANPQAWQLGSRVIVVGRSTTPNN